MTGDYHDTNKAALSKVTRLLRGDFNQYLDAPAVASNDTPEPTKEPMMAKKKATGRLPTMEDADEQDGVPSELIELGLQYQRGQKAESKAKANVKDLFAAIKDRMHKLGIDKFKVEVDGKKRWLKLDKTEKIKWEDVKSNKLKPNEIQ